VDGGPDRSLCIGDEITLNAGSNGIIDYQWYVDTLNIGMGGIITVMPEETTPYVVEALDLKGCLIYDTIVVSVFSPELFEDSTEVCIGGVVDIDAGYPGSQYAWSNGDNTQIITVGDPGIYTVEINSPEEVCPVTINYMLTQVIDICDPIINVPNAFSPNNDGNNDYFTVFGVAITDYEINIFNRWGELVYRSTDPGEINQLSEGWDGTYKGEPQEMGTFVYFINATGGSGVSIQKQGNLTLVR
jgi:gliding motility-associated-like protein